jgi:hypothetical protein
MLTCDLFTVKRTPVMLALGAFVGTAQGIFHVTGNRIDSFYKEEDEFERKEIVRRTTRVPIEQTIAELGEGRGKLPAFELSRFCIANVYKAFVLPDMRSGDESVLKRSMASRLTL